MAWDGIVYTNTTPDLTISGYRSSGNAWGAQVSNSKTYDFTCKWGTIKVKIVYSYNVPSSSSSSQPYSWVMIQVDGGEIYKSTKNNAPWRGGQETVEQIINIPAAGINHTLKVTALAQSWNTSVYSVTTLVSIEIDNTEFNLNKISSWNGKPRNEVNITGIVKTTTFGRHTDNSIYLGVNETTAVKTWEITLGQAVGYIEFGKFKIPYYE